MTPQELKTSILLFAMQGKLVKQNPSDGTAEDLINNIQRQRKEGETRGLIKKRRPSSVPDESECPFDLPVSWRWIKWGDIVNVVSARRVHQSDWKSQGIPFYRAREIAKLAENGFVDNELFISEELYELFTKDRCPRQGDLMVTAVGTLGKTYVVRENDKFYYKDASVICLENVFKLNSDYLKLVLESPVMTNQIQANSNGTTVATLTIDRMNEYVLPLPPLAEQKRIVEKIETLMPLVGEYERVWNRLEGLNKTISSELTRSLLKAAAEGKLPYSSAGNSQDNNYLQLVRDDSLAFEKTLGKKASPILPIEESEIPFDIPDNWSWMRLSQLVSKRIKRGKSPKYIKSSGVLVFAQKCNTKKGYIDLSLSQFLDESQLSKYDESEYMEDGDIVINSTGGGTLGRVGIYHTTDNPLKMPIVPDSHVTVIRVNPRVNNKFVYYVLRYYQPYLETLGDGSTNQTELNPMTIAKLLIPLPPRMEQDSIVTVLEAVLPLCRDLEANSIHE